MEIISDINKLRTVSAAIELEEGKKIAKKLFEMLAFNSEGYFLTASQIGTPIRVGVVNVRKPLLFINPVIVKQEMDIVTVESNLSFPNKLCHTHRSKIIAVNADNFEKTIIFGSNLPDTKISDSIVMEAIFVQAMVDMMDGVTMWDRQPQLPSNRVTIRKNGRERVIKKQKLTRFKNLGWKLK